MATLTMASSSTMQMSLSSRLCLSSYQIEAARIDAEMLAMFKAKLVEIFSMMKPGMLIQYEPELDALIEFLIWWFSILIDKPTPGNALMNLRYRNEPADGPGLTFTQKLWYCIATAFGQYVWVRLHSCFAFRRWSDLEQRSFPQYAWFCLQRIVGIYKAVSFGNLLIFLYTGKYRNLIERVLRVRLVYGSPDTSFCSDSENINSQNLDEFCCFSQSTEDIQMVLLPLICNLFGLFSNAQNEASAAGKGIICPICGSNPTISFVALPCQHRYCYYCLQTRCSAAPLFYCVQCSEPVTATRRYVGSIGDILK